MTFRKYKSGESVVPFWANGKSGVCELSNFSLIPEGIQPFDDGLVFPSSEHAFQSRKYLEQDRARFSVDGDLGTEDAFRLVFRKEEWEKKKKYWMKKNNIGIVAKMATNKNVGIKLGLRRDPGFTSTWDLWSTILHCKFSKEPFRTLLLDTGDQYLLEFGRGAKREEEKGESPIWNGIVVNQRLYGQNRMGVYLMCVREHIQ